jgi:hypothetical protein
MRIISLLLFLITVSKSSCFTICLTQPYIATTGRVKNVIVRAPNNKRCIESSGLAARLSDKRKKELGVADDEDEYDLSQALNANTDPLITKLIAGSLIIVILGLLIVAVIIPLTSEPVDGLCNPILNAGRC